MASDESFLCMFVNPFKSISQKLEVLKLIVFIWVSTHFLVLFFVVSTNLSGPDIRLDSHLESFNVCYSFGRLHSAVSN